MTSQSTDDATEVARLRVRDAETALEAALEAARRTGVGAVVAAAYDRLLVALVAYEAALTAWLDEARAA